MRVRLPVFVLLLALLLTGCGGGGNDAATSGGAAPPASAASPTGTGAGTGGCPTDNTRSFAKTRFIADLGGAAFLVRRYIYQPYQQGKFRKGANGRTFALIKAAAAATASAKLLKNASENAKADPTLCKTIATPLAQISGQLDGLVSSLRSGNFSTAAVTGLVSQVDRLRGLAGKAGIAVPETPTGLR